MAQIRAWQDVEPVLGGGQRIVHYLELDLACNTIGQTLDVRYVPFVAQEPTKLMADHAAWWSQFGPQAPNYRSVLVIRQSDNSPHFSDRYPGFTLPCHDGATIVSADAAEVALIMRAVKERQLLIEGKRPILNPEGTAMPDHALMNAVVERLWQESRILYFPAGKTDFRTNRPASSTIDLIAPLSTRAGHLSQQASNLGTTAAFNAGFFVSTEEEFSDPYTFAISPIGLVIVDGRVQNAPLFSRSALIFTHSVYPRTEDDLAYSIGSLRCMIRQVSLQHYAVKLPGNVIVHGELFASRRVPVFFSGFQGDTLVASLNPTEASTTSAAFYNRLVGLVQGETTAIYTPPTRDRLELIISGAQVCAVKDGGQTFIPRNGFVVSLPCSRVTERIMVATLQNQQHSIEQGIDLGLDVVRPIFGVQVGLRLLRQGKPVNFDESIVEEYLQMNIQKGEDGIPPVHLPPRHMFTPNRARIGVGLRSDNRCFVVLIEGCESRTFFSEYDSAGGSTNDLTTRFLNLGCHEAVALDEGGSAQIAFRGQHMARVADRNDVPLIPAERVIPGAWMVFDS